MNIVSIKVPVAQIAKGIKVAKTASSKLTVIDNNLKSFGETEAEARSKFGESGVVKRSEEIAKAEAVKAGIISDAQAEIKSFETAAHAFIDDQTTPNGDDIIGANAGDFALIEHGLIETPEKLQRVLDKHQNTAFRYAAQKYAAARNWEGFSFFTDESAVHEYTNQVFENLAFAAANPYSLVSMQYTDTPNEYARIAEAYGISEQFAASNGETLSSVISGWSETA